ncbi:hypothetical protein GGR52DRAFT_577045 [Hypoxylon sp. FL1284]|nr:hypothetical protein GGR52DRAFT_577045 [Hypoxylon sp. FL1284]
MSAAKAAKVAARNAEIVANAAAQEFHAFVVGAGLMDKTVKILLGGHRYEPKIKKTYKEKQFKLVRDPRNSVREGDVIAVMRGPRFSKNVRHIVKHIIAPCGEPIEARPPVPTLEEVLAEKAAKNAAKAERRAVRKGDNTGTADGEKKVPATSPDDVD